MTAMRAWICQTIVLLQSTLSAFRHSECLPRYVLASRRTQQQL